MSDSDRSIDSDKSQEFFALKEFCVGQFDKSEAEKIKPDEIKQKPFQIPKRKANTLVQLTELHNISNSSGEGIPPRAKKTVIKETEKNKKMLNSWNTYSRKYDHISDSDSEDELQSSFPRPKKMEQKPFRIPKKKPESLKQYSKVQNISDSDSEDELQRPNKMERKPFQIPQKKPESVKQSSKVQSISDSDSEDELQSGFQRPNKIERTPFQISQKKPDSLKQSSKVHSVSDSDGEDEAKKGTSVTPMKIKEIKTEVLSHTSSKPLCKYGNKCYRKNPEHLKAFSHQTDHIPAKRPKISSSPNLSRAKCRQENKESEMEIREKNVFGFYFTKVDGIPKQYNCGLALDIKDILSPSQGKLIASAQFNYMIDIPWLIDQYPSEFRKCPLTIVHGEQRASKQDLEKSAARYPNIKFCQAKLEILYGTHHTKMMLLLYDDGLRVVIHTSNLRDSDWFQKTQGMWISPKFPRLLNGPSLTDGESSTNFKAELIEYLAAYDSKELEDWIMHLKKHDFSQAKVFIIGSTPGRHIGSKKTAFGHLKLRKVLYGNGPSKDLVNIKWPVIGQFSSIGSLGPNPGQWLCGEWLMSLATVKGNTPGTQTSMLKLVYPSVDNVRCSLEGYPAGVSLPYSYKVALKQPYLKDFLHQWKSATFGRTEASPHIKTYLRTSPDKEQIAWLLVTSANLSKAAWGALEKKGVQLMIRSYELGVLFFPSQFNITDTFCNPTSQVKQGGTSFPVPFDVPLTPYENKDQPWIWDIPHIHAPDRYGNKWCPK